MLVNFLAGLLAVPVYLSGNAAEENVEDLPGVSHDVLEEHEDAGLFGLIAGIAAGLLGAVGLVLSRGTRTVARWVGISTLVIALWASAVFVRVAYLGGMIRHSEIRPGAAAGPADGAAEGEH